MPKFWSHRVTIVTGGYGSGKTEVAINLALQKNKLYEEVVFLVDLDIVNPYFRSRDKLKELAERGVSVIAPEGIWSTADLPALPAAIGGALQDSSRHVIIDVGGDPAGATALGRYSHVLIGEGYDMLMVINPHRPHTKDLDSIVELIDRIEKASRLKVTGLCNNANVLQYTTTDNLVQAHALLVELSAQTEIPLAFASCTRDLVAEVEQLLPVVVLPLSLSMRPPWLKE